MYVCEYQLCVWLHSDIKAKARQWDEKPVDGLKKLSDHHLNDLKTIMQKGKKLKAFPITLVRRTFKAVESLVHYFNLVVT